MKQSYFLLFILLNSLLIAQPGTESPITPITSSIPYQGYIEAAAHLGEGEYKIYYDNIDGILDKPIFFVDGFDPGDSRTIPMMYDLLNYGEPLENLGDIVRDAGYDIIVLNFPTYTSSSDGFTIIDGGGDYIQRNAFTLIELISIINELKTGNEENVVIGPSMGGLISRYALRYMEQNDLLHETRLYVSFDAPHLGANVPIGLQYLFNYLLNGDPNSTDAEFLVNGLLNSAAAKQMLIDHYSSHLLGNSAFEQDPSLIDPLGATNFRTNFQSELDVLGFPQNTRNIAITNGSGNGVMTGTPGMELINHLFYTGVQDGFDTRANMTVHFTPLADQTAQVCEFIGQFFFFVWIEAFSYSALAKSPSSSDGIDSAPGGQFDLYSFDDGTNPLITEFVDNLNSQYFNFIPTLSGLAIPNPNWYETPNAGNSPFDDVYIPELNEPHVTLTDGNVSFILDEIFQGTLNATDDEIASIRLKKNPIASSLDLLTSYNSIQAKINIFNTMGQLVYSTSTNLKSTTSLPLHLSSGVYILDIQTSTFKNYRTKLVVE